MNYDEERYRAVIEACALTTDLALLTEGGEKRNWPSIGGQCSH